MDNYPETTEESRRRWEANAEFWDDRMGEDSNQFHRRVVRPHTEELLDIHAGDLVLDVACGNGNFSRRLAEHGARVVAFDYSERMIARAGQYRSAGPGTISFHVADVTDREQIRALQQERPFDKAVACMAVMNISDTRSLFHGVAEVLRPGGIFVFSTHHPCFVRPGGKYRTAEINKGEAIAGQPVPHLLYHRPLQGLFRQCFSAGFVMDGFYEETDDDPENPVIIIVRLRRE